MCGVCIAACVLPAARAALLAVEKGIAMANKTRLDAMKEGVMDWTCMAPRERELVQSVNGSSIR